MPALRGLPTSPIRGARSAGIPTGKKLKYPLGTRERPYLDLRNLGPRGAAATRAIPVQNANLTRNSPADEGDPVWSPSGDKVLFVSNGEDTNGDFLIDKVRDDGNYHIWTMNPDGSRQQQVTFGQGSQLEPAWSPNGLRIAYASNEGGDFEIYLLTLSTGATTKLAVGTSEERHPTWAAGGDAVAFSTDRDGVSKIYTIKADGRLLTPLTKGPSEDRNPAWSPDGQWILFESNGTDTNKDGVIDSIGNQTRIWRMSYFGSQQEQLTAFDIQLGNVMDHDPMWDTTTGQVICFVSNRKDTNNDGVWDAAADYDVFSMPVGAPETPTTSAAVQRTQLAATEVAPLTGNEGHPGLFPVIEYNNPKVMYTEDQDGNRDIWITTLTDITDPRLEALPDVSPKLTIPGAEVTISARVSDLESGVRSVYAQIRDPDDAVTDALGQDHKVYQVEWDNTNLRAAFLPVWTEVDCHMVHATNYSYLIPPYRPRMDDYSLIDVPDLQPSDGWLQLFDDGNMALHGDAVAGDGLFSSRWKTPTNAQSDFYVDIIAYDKASNWKIYDGISGFSTQQFTATHGLLMVMDYAHGQKFMQGDRSSFYYSLYFPMWFPVESYYTRNPTGMDTYEVNPSNYTNNVIGLQPGQTPDLPPSLSIYAEDTFLRGSDMEGYDLWRVVCRGRLPQDVIASYSPRIVQQPDLTDPYGATRNQQVADRGILWVSPYSGNLWVGEGTIVDGDTQVKLANFMDAGGRLIVTGQDIAWALTRDGTITDPPLLARMGVRYVDDAPLWTVAASDGTARLRHASAGGPIPTEPWGVHWHSQARPTELHMPTPFYPYLTYDWYSDPPTLQSYVGIGSLDAWERANHTDTDAAGNQYWIDSIQAVAPARNSFTFLVNQGVNGNSTGVPAVYREDADSGSRSAYFAFGVEGVNREYANHTPYGDHCENLRHNLMHNSICWMRTGTIYGMVQFTAGLGPAKGALVQAVDDYHSPGTVMGQAICREDGTYEIEGLPSSIYRVKAILPGYTYDHVQRDAVHGAGRTQMSFRLSEAPAGAISGKVSEADGVTPVEGATITATLQGTYKGETVERVVKSDQVGYFIIPDVPTGQYSLKCAADGFTEQTYGQLVVVDPGTETQNINFVMGGVPGGVTGVVTRDSDGQPVAGATVELRLGTTLVAQGTTDSNGKFTFSNVPAGTYEINVTSGTGILPTSVSVVITANTQVKRNVVALTPPPAQVAGTVTDSLGAAVSGAKIEAVLDGTVVKTVLSGETQTQGSYSYNYLLTGLSAGSYTIRASKSGFGGASTSVRLSESQQLFSVNFTLDSLHVFSSGLTMVSTPYDYSATALPSMLGLSADQTKVATWASTRYAYYPESPADRFRVGTGYFLLLNNAYALTREGKATDTTKPASIKLTAGWNMIGNPFPFIVNWFDAKVVVGSQTLTLQDAIAQDIIKNALWTYGNSQYRLAFQLMPWEGYWVKATQDVTIQIPNVASRSVPLDPYRTRQASEDAWTLNLVAAAGGYRDASNYLGVSRGAHDGYDATGDAPEAPPTGMSGWAQLTFPHRTGWGRESGEYAVDTRAPFAREQVWEFEAGTSEPNTDVTVSWPNVGQLPRCYTAILEDVDTGARRYLRSLAAYVFNSGPQGGMRRFRLRIARQAQVRLAVTNLRIVPTRTGGGATLSCDMAETAFVRSEIRTPNGRLVREILGGETRSPGVNSFYWDGRDQRGVGLGYGLYFWFVEASAEDGRTVREFRPFIYAR